jgi:rRNA maturation endonuclease Nob1
MQPSKRYRERMSAERLAPDHFLTCPKCLSLVTRTEHRCPDCGARMRLSAYELKRLAKR